MAPIVSVIMPVYNASLYLREAVESILLQDFNDLELILVDDCSTDDSLNILEGFIDNRIIILKNQKNMGIVDTLNKGIEIASGRYIARMDSDDISMPNRISKQVNYLDTNPNVGVLGTWGNYIDENGNFLEKVRHPVNDKEIRTLLLAKNCIFHPSVMMRSELITRKRYSKGYKHAEDFYLWADLLRSTQFANINEYLINYRIRGTNLSILANKNVEERYNVLSRIYKNLFLSIGLELTDEELSLYTYSVSMLERLDAKDVNMIKIFNKILKNLPDEYNKKYLQKFYSLVWVWHTRFTNWSLDSINYNFIGAQRYLNLLLDRF